MVFNKQVKYTLGSCYFKFGLKVFQQVTDTPMESYFAFCIFTIRTQIRDFAKQSDMISQNLGNLKTLLALFIFWQPSKIMVRA